MSNFNPSAWAGSHRQLVLFLILACAAAGAFSYAKLGCAEDPSFTIKVMVFTARWPGATAAEVQDQVAERVEKKLQELPHIDRVESYPRSGFAAIQLKLRDDTPPAEVPDLWYQARKKINDIKPALHDGVIGPQADDEYGDVSSAVYHSSATFDLPGAAGRVLLGWSPGRTPMKKFRVPLTHAERQQLADLIASGKAAARKFARARVLLGRQCLGRRITGIEESRREVAAREEARNERMVEVKWRFTTADASIQPHRLYPSVE